MRKIALAIMFVLIFAGLSFAEQKAYTEDDLDKYRGNQSSVEPEANKPIHQAPQRHIIFELQDAELAKVKLTDSLNEVEKDLTNKINRCRGLSTVSTYSSSEGQGGHTRMSPLEKETAIRVCEQAARNEYSPYINEANNRLRILTSRIGQLTKEHWDELHK